jgi:hypothetical protein
MYLKSLQDHRIFHVRIALAKPSNRMLYNAAVSVSCRNRDQRLQRMCFA